MKDQTKPKIIYTDRPRPGYELVQVGGYGEDGLFVQRIEIREELPRKPVKAA